MILRDYQQQAVESACEHLEKHDATLIVAATGLGKTVMAGELIRRTLGKGRVMFIADREELLDQARDKIETITGIRPDLEMADSRACDGMFKSPIICSSIQTQRSGSNGTRRWNKFNPDEFALLFIDEADLAAADSYRAMIDHYRQNPKLKLAGCTATPDRHDEKALGMIFDSVCFEYNIKEAKDEGWLVPIVQKYLSVQVDFAGVRYSIGDFNGADLKEILSRGTTLEQIASDSIQYAGERRTLVFSDSIENAERLTEAYNRHRIGSAKIVTGETPKDERRELVADYRSGAFQYLVNVGVASRGFDVPEIGCVVAARPTCSRSLYQQQIGRGTRIWPGVIDGLVTCDERKAAIAESAKPDLLVLDIVGNSLKHKLITCADILGGTYDDRVVELAEREFRDSSIPLDVADALEKAQYRHNEEIEAEAKRKDALQLRRKSTGRDIDPFEVFGIANRPARGWDNDRPIDNEQRTKLEKWGIDGIDKMNHSSASKMIREFQLRTRRGLATYKQTKQLVKRWGMTPEEARRTTFEEAGRCMTILANNNWQRPKVTA
jgi:superfamily II DNA or RNA helicase